ncbi:hypothetical protein KNP414_02405 [Paenibacillus mucilaginosus KNP414]|uniref:Uncharacterized protein n=1 Tax=Paenibacillus mucilaginosus (strain KNP414) TaxID=1036673 RepID=F8F5F5_PAEMK|nr:hypothetical protein KNP414_02405 [Paenibacillus mucilaginosus KNP414]
MKEEKTSFHRPTRDSLGSKERFSETKSHRLTGKHKFTN